MSSRGGGGWMTTKKKGRDDRAIAAAQQKAKDNQRARRRLGPRKTKTRMTQPKAKPKTRQPKKAFLAGSDSEEFSIGDEEESEEEDVILSEEESEEDNDDEMLSAGNDDDSDEDGPSFLDTAFKGKKKNFKIKPMQEQAKKLVQEGRRIGYAFKQKSKSYASESSDEDDEEVVPPPPSKKKPNGVAKKKLNGVAAAKKKKAKDDSDNSSFHSDEEIDSPLPPPRRNHNGKKKKISKYFAGKKGDALASSEEDGDDDLTPGRPPVNNKRTTKKRVIANDLDDDDDSLAVLSPKAKSKRQSNGTSEWHPESDDEDDDDMDEDERLAMEAAMKASLKDSKTKKRLRKKGGEKNSKSAKRRKTDNEHDALADSEEEDETYVEKEKPKKVVVLESSDEENVDDDEEEDDIDVDDRDVYVDAEAREASNVLAAANELSASVLRTMTSWAADMNDGDEGGEPESGKLKVPQGMIVDGALAMTSMKSRKAGRASKNSSSGHSFISNETMQKVLPNVTLAEYQLVGVNWLAMLHSMTCTVSSSKNGKPTKVCGCLADEMGLGKTCQTISFLAWLKFSRSNGTLEDDQQVTKPHLSKHHDDASDHEDSDKEDGEKDPDVIDVDSDVDEPEQQKKGAKEAPRENGDKQAPAETHLPHLIVVPASVVSNWENEFARFAPDLHVVKYHGSADERTEVKNNLRAFLQKKRGAPQVDVVLTSITYFAKESSEDRNFLRKMKFDYLIVDEGHLLKNAKGLRYKNLDSFRTCHRLLLTGTPVQNSPQELMALLCFLMPLFSQKTGEFDEHDSDGGESMLQHFVTLEASGANANESSHEFAYRKLKQLFAPFVLRRRKKDVLSQVIPPKTYQVEMVQLGADARKTYDGLIANHIKAKKNKTNKANDHLFTALRKAAHHPHLLRTRHNTPQEIDHLCEHFHKYQAFPGEGANKIRVAKEIEGLSDFDIHLISLDLIEQNKRRSKELDRYLLSQDDLFASAKFVRLRALLPELIEAGHRILIFSVWTMCLDLLGCLLEQMDYDYMRMDGSTPVAERQERIDEFNANDSIPVFLLSTKACGMGINLTSADTCIMHDIDMNPFSDLQAEDRCHRIGQKKPVRIIKLIASETVDSNIYEMQERKKRMNEAIMEAPSSFNEKKEKTLIMKTVMHQHSKEASSVEATRASADGEGTAGKENVENRNGSKSKGKTKNDPIECDV